MLLQKIGVQFKHGNNRDSLFDFSKAISDFVIIRFIVFESFCKFLRGALIVVKVKGQSIVDFQEVFGLIHHQGYSVVSHA